MIKEIGVALFLAIVETIAVLKFKTMRFVESEII